MAWVLFVAVWVGAWAGLTLAGQCGLDPRTRIVWGFLGCAVVTVLLLIGAAAGRVRRGARRE